jgi:predicted secreted hydrolase
VNPRRRALLALPLLAAVRDGRGADYPEVIAGTPLAFPRDDGSHPQFRVEWWYVTGWITDAGTEYGMQITFFRFRAGLEEDNPSAFAPRQLLFAHAALADPSYGRLRHDVRAARAGLGLAQADETMTRVWIDDWRFEQDGDAYVARIAARDFAFDLRFTPTQGVLLQGERGVSRKGPLVRQASYYYSRPQLAVSGELTRLGKRSAIGGRAWLDHEWSSEYMAKEAVGWDWTGINFDDGGALMAFRMRGRDGVPVWAAGTYRGGDGTVRSLGPNDVRFTPQRRWQSPRTSVEYPVEMNVAAGDLALKLAPLLDDQELDARASTGTLYWEGAVRALANGREAGRGYLELTGYGKPLQL